MRCPNFHPCACAMFHVEHFLLPDPFSLSQQPFPPTLCESARSAVYCRSCTAFPRKTFRPPRSFIAYRPSLVLSYLSSSSD